MRIYIATPINARKGKNLIEKLAAAKQRIELLKDILLDEEQFQHCTCFSTFDVPHRLDEWGAPLERESVIMGDCVIAVLESDGIYLDHGWQASKGCNLEYRAAKIYGKMIFEHDKL